MLLASRRYLHQRIVIIVRTVGVAMRTFVTIVSTIGTNICSIAITVVRDAGAPAKPWEATGCSVPLISVVTRGRRRYCFCRRVPYDTALYKVFPTLTSQDSFFADMTTLCLRIPPKDILISRGK